MNETDDEARLTILQCELTAMSDEMKQKNKNAKQACMLAFTVFCRVCVYPDSLGSTQYHHFYQTVDLLFHHLSLIFITFMQIAVQIPLQVTVHFI